MENWFPLDGDTYEEDDTVLEYEEWSKPEENIKSGLTVVIDWIAYKTSEVIVWPIIKNS